MGTKHQTFAPPWTDSAPPYPLQDFKALYKCCIIILLLLFSDSI